MKVLITKILTDLQRKQVANMGVALTERAFIKIELLEIDPKWTEQPLEHLIFTSQNAVKALLNQNSVSNFQFERVSCVGQKTKKLLEKNGFQVSYSASNSKALAVKLGSLEPQTFVWFCGNLRLPLLPEIFRNTGHKLSEVLCYNTLPAPKKLEADFDVMAFFSPSGVKSYALKNSLEGKLCLSLGSTTTAAIKKAGARALEAETPSTDAVLKLLATCVKNHKHRNTIYD